MNREPPNPRHVSGATLSRRRSYDRRRDLPALIAVWPSEIDDRTRSGQFALLAKLRRALRMERQRGLAGHWTYDLSRHAQLVSAYRQELAQFQRGTFAAVSGQVADAKLEH